MKHPHYFIALKLPKEVKYKLYNCCEKLKKQFPFSKWVHMEDYHLTLAFLGALSNDQLTLTCEYVEAATKAEESFTMAVNKMGIFGNVQAPRVFWADVEKEKRLFSLQKKVYNACINAGCQLETRPFCPHITLARKWRGIEHFDLEMINSTLINKQRLEFLVEHVVLYKTNIEKVPKYEPLKVFRLQS